MAEDYLKKLYFQWYDNMLNRHSWLCQAVRGMCEINSWALSGIVR